jgi:hypothetical protein
VKGSIDVNVSYTDNLDWIAKGEGVRDLVVIILLRDNS